MRNSAMVKTLHSALLKKRLGKKTLELITTSHQEHTHLLTSFTGTRRMMMLGKDHMWLVQAFYIRPVQGNRFPLPQKRPIPLLERAHPFSARLSRSRRSRAHVDRRCLHQWPRLHVFSHLVWRKPIHHHRCCDVGRPPALREVDDTTMVAKARLVKR